MADSHLQRGSSRLAGTHLGLFCAEFPAEVKILSTKRTAEWMASEEPKSIAAEKIYGLKRYHHFDSLLAAYRGDTTATEYQIIKLWRAYYQELAESYEKIKTRLPDTYVLEEMSLDGSKRKVRLRDEGAGHTQCDLLLTLPDDSTIFAGDLVFNRILIFSSGGKTIRLQKSRITFERRPDGIMIRAIRWTFQAAGLNIK